jgi:hypothetical protein
MLAPCAKKTRTVKGLRKTDSWLNYKQNRAYTLLSQYNSLFAQQKQMASNPPRDSFQALKGRFRRSLLQKWRKIGCVGSFFSCDSRNTFKAHRSRQARKTTCARQRQAPSCPLKCPLACHSIRRYLFPTRVWTMLSTTTDESSTGGFDVPSAACRECQAAENSRNATANSPTTASTDL